jgi:hypothetical protein
VAVTFPSGRKRLLNGRTVVAVALLLMSACGGESIDATDGTSGPPTSPDAANGEPISSVPWGPDDQEIPGQYAALSVSSADDLDCDAIDQQAPESGFWDTVLEVCRALKGDAEWPTSWSLDPPQAENGYQDCLNRELTAMLEALSDWRDEHPDAEPVVVYPSGSDRSPCRLHIYGASAVAVSPDALYPTAGVVVELHVHVAILGEPDPPEVLVDGEPVVLWESFSGGDENLVVGEVFITAPVDAREATVIVRAGFGDVTGKVVLPEVPPSIVSASPTGSPTTTPS